MSSRGNSFSKSGILISWLLAARKAPPSCPVRTRLMSRRPASCCALILAGSSGAGARCILISLTLSGLAFLFLYHDLSRGEIAAGIDDRQNDWLGRQDRVD
jgi:hypothetical protein